MKNFTISEIANMSKDDIQQMSADICKQIIIKFKNEKEIEHKMMVFGININQIAKQAELLLMQQLLEFDAKLRPQVAQEYLNTGWLKYNKLDKVLAGFGSFLGAVQIIVDGKLTDISFGPMSAMRFNSQKMKI